MTDKEQEQFQAEAFRHQDMSLGENFAEVSMSFLSVNTRLNDIEANMATKKDLADFGNSILKILNERLPPRP